METSQEQGLLELKSQTTEIEEIYKLKIGKRRGQEFKMFSFSEIVAATDDFSFASKLGEGGFGPVYKVKSRFLSNNSYIGKWYLTLKNNAGGTAKWATGSSKETCKTVRARTRTIYERDYTYS